MGTCRRARAERRRECRTFPRRLHDRFTSVPIFAGMETSKAPLDTDLRPMLQRLAAWSYRRRRRVVVLWIVALILVSAIGSTVGSTFSQGFARKGTESQKAADLLEARFPSRAGDEGQIVFARARGVQ